MPKVRTNRIIPAVLGVILAAAVSAAVTYGWYVNYVTPGAGVIERFSTNDILRIYVSDDRIEYSEIPAEVCFEGIVPGSVKYFKAGFIPAQSDWFISGKLLGLTPPGEQNTEGGADLADVLIIKYTFPGESTGREFALSSLFQGGTRDIVLFEGTEMRENAPFEFYFSVSMEENAGNNYRGGQIAFEQMIFYIQP